MDKLKLLRTVVANLHTESLPPEGPITEEQLRQSPFARALLGPRGYVGVLKAGGEALSDLTDALFHKNRTYERGTTFEEISTALFRGLLEEFLESKPAKITAADVALVERTIEDWYTANSDTHHLYIPCILTPRLAPAFDLGPVRFMHVTDFVTREQAKQNPMFEITYGMMLRDMELQRAFWIAEVDVDRSMPKRARELGELAVDLAVAGLQVLIHPDHSRHMGRLTGRMPPRHRFNVSTSNGTTSPSVVNEEPGLLLGPGTFECYLNEGRPLLRAAGSLVSDFLSQNGALRTLAGAWADAAYWYHEGLAESLDTIAVPKLETAIEVLLRSEKSAGSEARVCQAISAFYGLQSDDLINPNSTITVRQFAKGFVKDRSMILHGTLSTLLSSMRASRSSLERLVAGLLAGYAMELQTYAAVPGAIDARDLFLTFVEGRRAKT